MCEVDLVPYIERVYDWLAAVRCIFCAPSAKEIKGRRVFKRKSMPLILEIASCLHSPNKALEPTPTVGGFGEVKFSIFMSATSLIINPVGVAHL